MPIHFDEINLSAGMVGAANGLTHSEIKQHTVQGSGALRSFRKSSEAGLYGFPHMPFQAQLAKEILAYAGQMRDLTTRFAWLALAAARSAHGRWTAAFVVRIRCKARFPRLIRAW